MKIMYVICAFVLVACLHLEANAQTGCLIEGEYLPVMGVYSRNCIKYTCAEGGFVSTVGCAESRCRPGTFKEMKPLDLSKPYPECCPSAVCYI